MTRLSAKKRYEIVLTYEQLQDISKTARHLSYSHSLVKRWVSRFQATGGVADLPRIGRTHALSPSASKAALDLLLGNQHGGAVGVAKKLLDFGITEGVVHKTTVIRAARRIAQQRGLKIKAFTGTPKKMLSAATKLKRLAFCEKHKNSSWKHVMFTDRKKFAFSNPGVKVHPVTWGVTGGERRAPAPNHAAVVNVYAGITSFGMTKLHVVAGTTSHKTAYLTKQGKGARNITAMEYRDVLTKTLQPEGRRIFGAAQGISSWVLQQDNDPSHNGATAVVSDYNQKNGSSIRVMHGWPPSSPDLSLIENVWAYLQARMDGKGCTTFTEYKAALREEAKTMSKDYCKRLFAGMQRRVQSCITNKGDLTKH